MLREEASALLCLKENKLMKYSNIGGQAVMEGVMMRNGALYAVAVRTADNQITVQTDAHHSAAGKSGRFRLSEELSRSSTHLFWG